MRHSLALVLLILLTQDEAAGQPYGWYWQSPLPQGNTLNGIHRTDEGRHVVVGDYGTILVKNAFTWDQAESGTRENLYAVCFSGTAGWSVGYNGTILRNTDGTGTAWTEQNSGTTKVLLGVHFIDPMQGWVVGQEQTVLHTTNAGESWNPISFSGTQQYYAVQFLDPLNGWIAGGAGYNGIVKKTTNGGTSWSNSLIPNKRMKAIAFVNDSVGCVVGDSGRVYTTGNGGDLWSQADSHTGSDLEGLFLKQNGEGWATGADGTLIYTTDFGNNWTVRSSPTGNTLYGVRGDYAVGWGGVIVQLGDPCLMESSGLTDDIRGIDIARDALRGFAVGQDGHLYYTSDAGATWSAEPSGTANDLYALHVVSGDVGWTPLAIVVGERGTVLYGSHDYWLNRSIATTDRLYGVHRFVAGGAAGMAWVAGEWGRIWHTTNYGESWTLQHENTSYHLYAIQFTSRNYGWAAGMSGTVLRTTNGGDDWIDVSPNTTRMFGSVCFLSPERGWVVGGSGAIFRTTDGGTTWVQQAPQVTTRSLNAVKFVNEDIGWIAGSGGTILHTTNGGEVWQLQNSGCIGELWAMDFPDVGIGWISGFDGIVLHTEDGGGTMTYETYERPSIDLPIPDPGEVSDTLEVEIFPRKPAATVVSGLTVLVDSLTHPNLSDLVLLLAHGGVTDTLVAQGEMSGSHIGRCRFTDGSSTPVGEGEAPYADAYGPHNPLSVFHGKDPLGAWKLSVLDLVSGNAGTLHSWGVRISAESVTGADDGLMEVPERFILYQNYPNPFNPATTIRYALPRAGHVRLAVYTVLGQEIRILVNGTEAAGDHSVQLDAAGFPTGVYFYRLQSGGYSSTRKLLVVR